MHKILKIARIFVLVLILPVLAIFLFPSKQVNADCVASGNITVDSGLLSTSDLNANAFKKGDAVSCITGPGAAIPQFAIQSYDEMKTLYFDQAKSSYSKIPLSGDRTQNDASDEDNIALAGKPSDPDLLYHITGNLIINHNITIHKTGVIFVDGNLYINKDLTHNNDTEGLVFVVQGTIYIDRTVAIVDAFLIAHGKSADGTDKYTPFCSAWDGTTPPAEDGTDCADYDDADADVASREYLTINGSVISLSTANTPQFFRQKSTLTNPAETINYEPKYLVILKDIFSRDLKIWKEVQ